MIFFYRYTEAQINIFSIKEITFFLKYNMSISATRMLTRTI